MAAAVVLTGVSVEGTAYTAVTSVTLTEVYVEASPGPASLFILTGVSVDASAPVEDGALVVLTDFYAIGRAPEPTGALPTLYRVVGGEVVELVDAHMYVVNGAGLVPVV